MFPKALMFAVAVVASVTVAAMDLAVLSQNQQDADARGCRPGFIGDNASQGKCVKPDLQAENVEADGAADEEEGSEEDNSNDDDEEADDE